MRTPEKRLVTRLTIRERTRREKTRVLRRVVLEVAVDRDHGLAASLVESGDECRRLSEVAAQPDDADVLLCVVQPRQRAECSVCGAVVDEDRLPGSLERLEGRAELVVEQCDAALLVVHRNDDRNHGAEPTVRDASGPSSEPSCRPRPSWSRKWLP